MRAIEQSGEAIVLTAVDGTVVYANPQFTRTTGYTPEEIVGRNPRILKSGLTSSKTYSDLWNTILSGNDWRGTLQNRRKNGDLYWQTLTISPVKDAYGVSTHLIGVSADVTEGKEAEQRLRDRERRFRDLVESTSDWVWEIDENAVYTYSSPKVKELLGYEPEEIVGKTLFDLMPREEAKRVGEEVEPMTVARRRIAGLENVNVHKNGRHVVLETSGVPIFDAEGNYRGYRGIDRDITARKLVDEALTRSEQEYRGVVERALQGIYKTTEEGKILMANPAMVRMLGFDSEDELLALDSVADLYVRSEDRREVLRKMGQADDTTVELKHKDGRKLTVRVSGTFVANTPEGTPVFQGMIQDITDRGALEEQLRQSQRLEALGQLAGGVAHDFNNILSVIIVEAQLAMKRLEQGDPVRERLGEIRAAGDRAAALTKQLLAFSRK